MPDQMLLAHLRSLGPKTKLELLQVLTPGIFQRLCSLGVLVDELNELNIKVYRVGDDFCGE
jgi:hypothetical protein